jgi:hypothetical protein
MRKFLLQICICLLIFVSCKKDAPVSDQPVNTQLYPLTQGNKWLYIDSFFDFDGTYYGFDTFYLKAAKTITQNNEVYTPISDQYDEPIFTVRSDDSLVFILEERGEALMFVSPLPENQHSLSNSYFDNALQSKIYTHKITSTNYPCYRILITEDDGIFSHYKQEEFYFTIGVGIIQGYTRRKTSVGDLFISDSYVLIGFNIN